MKKLFSFLLSLILLSSIILSGCGGGTTIPVMFTGSVVGVIVDSGNPVAGANVELNGSIFTTKEDGKFQFNGISFDGSIVKIRVTYNGKYFDDNRVVTELDRKNKLINFGNVSLSKSTKILICGNYNNSAFYWEIKNGIAAKNLIESEASVDDIYYYKNTVYTCGNFSNDGGGVCYWEGTKRNKLEDHGAARSITIVNDTIYIGGIYVPKDKTYVPCYWVIKNGQKQRIDIDNPNGYVTEIYVTNDGTVYNSGYFENNKIINACYWKNSERTNLFSENQTKNESYNKGIYFADGIVYSVGWYNGVITNPDTIYGYWLNNNFKELARSPASVSGMTVQNNKIYICGSKASESGFWENETFKGLGQSDEIFKSIKVSNDGTVYIISNHSGNKDSKCFIYNDEKTSVIPLEQSNIYATQIFIAD